MVIAIVGSRDGLDWPRVNETIRGLVSRPDVSIVVSGGARGVDRIGETLALASGKRTQIIRPNVEKHHSFGAAAFARNVDIVKMADEVHAFWDGKSKGTAHTIEIAKRMKKPVTVYEYPDRPQTNEEGER